VKTKIANIVRAAFLLTSMAMVVFGVCWQLYAMTKWGAAGPPG
jgi:hypothetical protein